MPTRTPAFTVKIAGQDITSWVAGLTVIEDDQQADNVSLTIPDPRMMYADALLEGSTAEVSMGYASPGTQALMIRAIITKVELSYPESGIPTLSLKGEDRSIAMGLKENKTLWDGKKAATVSAVVKQIASQHRFTHKQVDVNPDPKLTPKNALHQDGKTDLAFLQELAKTYHAKCFIELDARGDEVLYFIPERRIVTRPNQQEVVLRYRMGPDSNLLSFSPSFDSSYIDRITEKEDIDASGQPIKTQDKSPPQTAVWSLDPELTALANATDQTRINALYNAGKQAKIDLQRELTTPRKGVGEVAIDQASMEMSNDVLESRRFGMTASGSTFGNIWLRAKSLIDIQGVNSRFRGKWYVSNVTNKIDGGGFKTDFKCVR
jgi:phage protein D